jgi:hypothetical protein
MVAVIASILLASSAWAQWNIQTVDNSGNTGQNTAVAYDSQGYPHIGYSDAGGDIYHTFWTGNAWQTERVCDGTSSWASPPVGISIDNAGVIYMVYAYSTSGPPFYYRVAYSRKTSSGWLAREDIHSTQDNSVKATAALGLAIDQDGVPHVSYCPSNYLCHVYKPSSSWVYEAVDQAGTVGKYSSIVSDASGHLYVAYSDHSDYDLKFAYRDDSLWSTQIVDMGGTVANYGLSIKLDGSGNPCIAYYDQTNGDLKYAKFTGTLEGKFGRGPVRRK